MIGAVVAAGVLGVARVVAERGSSGEEVVRLRFAVKAGDDIEGLAFSHYGNWVATPGRQQLMRVLDTRTGAERVAVWFNREARLVAFSPDGSLVAVVGDVQAVLVDPATGKVVRGLAGFVERSTEDVAFSPDGSMFAVVGGSSSGALGQAVLARIWSVDTGKLLRRQSGPRASYERVVGVDYSADGTLLATASSAGLVNLWDAETGDWRRALTVGSRLSCMALRPDGRLIALGTFEKGIVLLDLATGLEVGRFHQGLRNPTAVAFSPGDRTVAASFPAGTTQIWDVKTGDAVAGLDSDTYSPMTFAFSPDGKLLATGDRTGTLRIWELAGGGG